MSNIKSIISSHNKAQINKSDPTSDSNCNCRNPNAYPMDENCNDMNIIYQAEISTPNAKETYIGRLRHDLQAKIPKSRVHLKTNGIRTQRSSVNTSGAWRTYKKTLLVYDLNNAEKINKQFSFKWKRSLLWFKCITVSKEILK